MIVYGQQSTGSASRGDTFEQGDPDMCKAIRTTGVNHANAFREVMASVCTPVTVITALRDQTPFGTTVSAFASLSVAPPMVVVALDRNSDLLRVVSDSHRYGVNVLGKEQADVARRFATKGGPDKFSGVGWYEDHELPRLPDASGFLACDVAEFVDGGDHVLLLGTVSSVTAGRGGPLTYHGRRFGTHEPFED
jgi:flavin reductase (DIM6/NTAB) family NADH-FMN oxidoreductase RutF